MPTFIKDNACHVLSALLLLVVPLCSIAVETIETQRIVMQENVQDCHVDVIDSAANSCVRFNTKQLFLPVSLISIGVFGSYNVSFHKINESVVSGMNNLRGSHYFRLDDYVQYLPALGYAILGFTGLKAKHSLKERLAVGVAAFATMAAITNVVKYSIREKRPDSSRRNSFPSGHTATAFTGAELIRVEYGIGPGVVAYVVATNVAFLRLYNNRHWLNDVIGGAGLGILSARIGYWMLPVFRKWLGRTEKTKSIYMSAVPGFNINDRCLSMNIAIAL